MTAAVLRYLFALIAVVCGIAVWLVEPSGGFVFVGLLAVVGAVLAGREIDRDRR